MCVCHHLLFINFCWEKMAVKMWEHQLAETSGKRLCSVLVKILQSCLKKICISLLLIDGYISFHIGLKAASRYLW